MTDINSAAIRDEQMNNRLMAFRLPDYLLKRVDDLCRRCKITRSKFLRCAIIDFFESHDELER
jgi:metal-responsive CopG/Arc/MetJ family transcriptional regulator